MRSKWQWLLVQLGRTLWVRAVCFSVLAIVAALLAIGVGPLVPASLANLLGQGVVDHVLDIMAGSMLAVTTFSLTVMVSAYGSATASVTPRAVRLLMQDTTSQNVLSTFLGAFLYSLVAIVMLGARAYDAGGRFVLFLVTLTVIVLVVLALLRWISHLTTFGRVGDTTRRVEEAAAAAVHHWVCYPCLGAQCLDENVAVPPHAVPVFAACTGYVQHLDVGRLAQCAQGLDADIYVLAPPGSFVHGGRPLARVVGAKANDIAAEVAAAFTVGEERSFDQDPRFGLCVLAEIASRALSPAVNDPGTAIDVLGRSVRILSELAPASVQSKVQHTRLFVPPLSAQALFDDFFTPIARDGAGHIEVQVRLQKVLHALAVLQPVSLQPAASRHSALALERALQALPLAAERDGLASEVAQLFPRTS